MRSKEIETHKLSACYASVSILVLACATWPSSTAAQTMLNPSGLITSSDYPAGSMSRGEEGIAAYELTLKNGRPASCKIISSAGYEELDDATCRLAMERSLFDIGTLPKGIWASYANRVRWQINPTGSRPTYYNSMTATQSVSRIDPNKIRCSYSDGAVAFVLAGSPCIQYLSTPTNAPPPAPPVTRTEKQAARRADVDTYAGGRPCNGSSGCYSPHANRLDVAYGSAATTYDQRAKMDQIIRQNTSKGITNWDAAAGSYFFWRDRPFGLLSKNQLCKDMKKSRKTASPNYSIYLAELSTRGLTEKQCAVQWGKILLAVGAVAVVAAVVSDDSGGGTYGAARTEDVTFHWDEQPGDFGVGRRWVCRGEQTGQYAETTRCAGTIQADTRWPD
jgi:hypothetical protein